MKQLTTGGLDLAYSGDVPEGTAQLAGTGLAAADANHSTVITRLELALEQHARIGEEVSAALRALTRQLVQPTALGLEATSSASASDSATLTSEPPTLSRIGDGATLISESAALPSESATASICECATAVSESPTASTADTPSASTCESSPTVVRCLGSLEVHIGGVPIQSWRSGKARAVFEYLVTHRRRPVPRDTLIQALWPDPDALASGTSLKVAVHALRQIFSASAQSKTQPKLSVVVQESTYQIHAPGLWLDVEEFERLCSLGAQKEARGQHQEALGLYRRAADLYRGDFLPESWDEWAIFRREGLKDQYLFVLAKLADAALQAADYHTCIRLCRQLLEQDCCREDTFRMLMVCHARLGQRGRVRRWYELCVLTLRSALEVEPEPETVRVYEWASGRAAPPIPQPINPTLTVA